MSILILDKFKKTMSPTPVIRLLTADDFTNLGEFKNVTPAISEGTGVDRTDMFTIAGRADIPWSPTPDRSKYLRWDAELNFDYISEVRFWAKKNLNHGGTNVYVSDGLVDINFNCYGYFNISYSQTGTDWTEVRLNTSHIRGVRVLSFVGGYGDRSGSVNSSTSFSNIQLVNYFGRNMLPKNNLLAEYTFDATNGRGIFDTSFSGLAAYNITANNDFSNAEGFVGQALGDPLSGWITPQNLGFGEVPWVSEIFEGEFSLSFYIMNRIRYVEATIWMGILGSDKGSGYRKLMLGANRPGVLNGFYMGDGSGVNYALCVIDVNDLPGFWTIVGNGQDSDTYSVYKNGSYYGVFEKGGSGAVTGLPTLFGQARDGENTENLGLPYFDEFRAYSKMLSEEEVNQIYQLSENKIPVTHEIEFIEKKIDWVERGGTFQFTSPYSGNCLYVPDSDTKGTIPESNLGLSGEGSGWVSKYLEIPFGNIPDADEVEIKMWFFNQADNNRMGKFHIGFYNDISKPLSAVIITDAWASDKNSFAVCSNLLANGENYSRTPYNSKLGGDEKNGLTLKLVKNTKGYYEFYVNGGRAPNSFLGDNLPDAIDMHFDELDHINIVCSGYRTYPLPSFELYSIIVRQYL